jgi:hypothetical protein
LIDDGYLLAMVGYLKNDSPEPHLKRITDDEDKYKSSIVKVKPRLQLIREAEVSSVGIAANRFGGCEYLLKSFSN